VVSRSCRWAGSGKIVLHLLLVVDTHRVVLHAFVLITRLACAIFLLVGPANKPLVLVDGIDRSTVLVVDHLAFSFSFALSLGVERFKYHV
jgi:hypothetical protein